MPEHGMACISWGWGLPQALLPTANHRHLCIFHSSSSTALQLVAPAEETGELSVLQQQLVLGAGQFLADLQARAAADVAKLAELTCTSKVRCAHGQQWSFDISAVLCMPVHGSDAAQHRLALLAWLACARRCRSSPRSRNRI